MSKTDQTETETEGMTEDTENAKVASESLKSIISDLEKNLKNLQSKTISISPSNSVSFFEDEDRTELYDLLLSMKTIHGMIIGMHPESPYTEEKKTQSIYDKMITISEVTNNFVDAAVDVFQYLESIVTPFMMSEEYCFGLLTKSIGNTQWSLKSVLLRVVSNSKLLLSYLKHVAEFEYVKGFTSQSRTKGQTDALPQRKPPEEPSGEGYDETATDEEYKEAMREEGEEDKDDDDEDEEDKEGEESEEKETEKLSEEKDESDEEEEGEKSEDEEE